MATTPTPLSSTDSASLNIAAMSNPTPTISRLFSAGADTDSPSDPVDSRLTKSDPSHFPAQNGEEDVKSQDQENVSPSKARHSRILSGNGLSPLKILASQDTTSPESQSPQRSSAVKSPKKWSPDKRFPVKVNSAVSPEKPTIQHREITLEDALAENKGLAHAIDIFEDDDTMMENADDGVNDTFMSIGQEGDHVVVDDEQPGPDDTMISTFSTFSAVPNLTMFARIGHTPTKFANVDATPTARNRVDLLSQQTPRPGTAMRESGNTTNLLDFTEQIQSFSSRYAEQMSNLRRGSPAKSSANTIAVTPKKRHTDLLDFDIPPLPTPRSIPTITPRELESLKSGFLSEISSLKASLSGKEAEALSLKTAVADAEKRVGECMEELREVKAVKESLVEQQESWEQRGRDMESVLRKVKEEIVRSQRERDQLESKFEESEKRREAAEIMAQEAESKMAAMRAGKTSPDAPSDPANKSPEKNKLAGSREVEIAVEKVSRELHALYKSKHESKITALKKSYENRWSKKVHELEAKVEELIDENEKIRAGRDATITKVDPNQSIIDDERKAQAVKDSTQIKELNAEVQKLSAVITSVKSDNQELRLLLEKERVEKGELVQLAEEMMSMQSFVQTEAPQPPPSATKPQSVAPKDFRSSVRGGSGLRPPASAKKPTESRIGGPGSERKIGGLPRPGSGTGSRSGIMSSIEKMGSYRGRGE
ncbi:hypothetical protein F5B22DRAFT_327612 [Xylaria bambusicola]|uniref:uncharacterized protein n=1 Tax=Xylaria bambusicola TaxID=326684 RepID=UPI002008DB8B|nr:uncharacterized protein F5B22DRAFT_327612 [Xylaria bambusicola]KAI0509385.1 hypothetical protein F5B22DRAFT_327612 [Xylaria bambusicola]